MQIKRIKVGYLETNCYILIKNNECLIIDPGAEGKKIIEEVGENKVKGILITHSHPDHIGALKELKEHFKCDVYDKDNLNEGKHELGVFTFEVIYTPGHTSDSLSYYFDNKYLFTGDFLFKGTIGRTDLPTGNYDKLLNSLEKIKKYPKEIKIYPGHMDETTLIQELETNPYMQ